jgi:uncharacterized protein (TIGR03086 family)
MTTLGEHYRLGADAFGSMLERVPSDAWARTTRCCPDWSVHDLVNHVVNETMWIPPLLKGETITDVGDRLDGDLISHDPVDAWRQAAGDVVEALAEPGTLDRTVELSSGPTTGAKYVAEVLSDQIIHTWDLATSIGADPVLDPTLVTFARQTLEPLAEMWRQAGALGPPVEVADDADDQTRFLALLGRRATRTA